MGQIVGQSLRTQNFYVLQPHVQFISDQTIELLELFVLECLGKLELFGSDHVVTLRWTFFRIRIYTHLLSLCRKFHLFGQQLGLLPEVGSAVHNNTFNLRSVLVVVRAQLVLVLDFTCLVSFQLQNHMTFTLHFVNRIFLSVVK